MRPDKVTLVMGNTGTGKSSLAATQARWVWDRFKKKTLLYLSDAGGTSDGMLALAKLGIVYIWKISGRVETPETCDLASLGYWPETWDPATGNAPAQVKLIAPVMRTYRMFCPAGHLVIEADSDKKLTPTQCPICKRSGINKALPGVCVDVIEELHPFFNDIGNVIYDSISTMQDAILRYEEQLGATLERGVLKSPLAMKSGDLVYGTGSETHYGFAQMRAFGWIMHSLTIPYLVTYPLFTAHECLTKPGKDNQKGESYFGPKLAGSARTGEITKYIGNLLGTSISPEGQWRLHVRSWYDTEGGKHAAKCRAEHDEDLRSIAPDGFLVDAPGDRFKKFNLGYLYDELAKIQEKGEDRARTEIKDAPGLPSGKIKAPEGTGPQASATRNLEGSQKGSPLGSKPAPRPAGGARPTAAPFKASVSRQPARPVIAGKKPPIQIRSAPPKRG